MPEVHRTPPPYRQIVAHYRDLVERGELRDGDRLPSARQMATQWGVAHATAAKVVADLRELGLVRTTSGGAGGTFVHIRPPAEPPAVPSTPATLDGFAHYETACELYAGGNRPKTVCRLPAVWTLAHRGYSGGGRLDVWVYPSKLDAERAGAELAMASGLSDDPTARKMFAAGRFADVLQHYEDTAADATHLLTVQVAFLHPIRPDQHHERCPDRRRPAAGPGVTGTVLDHRAGT